MTIEAAFRASEVLLALALLQQCGEHLVGPLRERSLFAARAVLCLWLLSGVAPAGALVALCGLSLVILWWFQGPYNGGSDRMGLLIMWCLMLCHLVPEGLLREAVFGYLGVQVVLSYVVSGVVKIVNPAWRSGQALCDVFAFSAYPVSEGLRKLARRRRLLWTGSWAVMLFEVGFPMAFVSAGALIVALVIGAAFHLANACVFGLNRFFWIWIAAYPSLIWLQGRVV